MKRTVMGTFAAVLTAAALVTAQEAAQTAKSDKSDQNKPAASTSVEQSVTYTGCLEAGSTPGTYVLSNASEVKQTTTTTSSTSRGAATQSTTTGAANPSFKLIGTPVGFNLDANLNHKVQVSGTFVEAKSTEAVAPSAPRTQPQPEPRTEPAPNEPRVQPMPETPSPSTQVAMKSITINSAKSLADRCAELYH